MKKTNMAKTGIGFAAVLALGLAACTQPPVPEDQFYRLQVSAEPARQAQPVLKGVLEVSRLLADGITAGRPVVYSLAGNPNQLREYNYHFWTEPPTVMLQGQLIKYLRSAGVADNIVTPEMRVASNYVLSGKIHRLEKVVGSSPKVALELELAVRESKSEKLIYLNSYNVEVAASSDSIPDAVAALNDALGAIYARFVGELAARK